MKLYGYIFGLIANSGVFHVFISFNTDYGLVLTKTKIQFLIYLEYKKLFLIQKGSLLKNMSL